MDNAATYHRILFLESFDEPTPEPHHIWCDPDDHLFSGHTYPLCCDFNCPACLAEGLRELTPEEESCQDASK